MIVALFDKKNHQVKAYFALGCEETPALEHFKVNLQPVNLFHLPSLHLQKSHTITIQGD